MKNIKETKPSKVHELKPQAAVEPWTQQQFAVPYQQTAYYSTHPQSETLEAAFHNMQTVQVHSLNKQENNRHIQPLWLTTQLDAQVHQFDCEVDLEAGCNIMFLNIYRLMFGENKLEPLTLFINGYSDSPIKKSRLVQSLIPHWVSNNKESSIPGHRHKRISHPWP